MASGCTIYTIYLSDTPNTGRWKINLNFQCLATGIATGFTSSFFTNPNPTTTQVGGILPGSTFPSTYDIQQMLDLALYGAVTPNFSAFDISAQPTTIEVGDSISGNTTFTWTIANVADLQPNSISIVDTTNATSLATGLNNDGTETIFLSSVTKTSPGSNVWTISGEDTNTISFSKTFTVEWLYRAFYGSHPNSTLTSGQIQGLSSSLQDDIDGTYSFASGDYKYVCVPESWAIPTGFRDDTTNIPYVMAGPNEGYSDFDGSFYHQTVSVSRGTATTNYRVYRTKEVIAGTITMDIRIVGGTIPTDLQSVLYAGNVATGNMAVLGSFSANTYFSGQFPLDQIFLTTATTISFSGVQSVGAGNNAYTGGTGNNPIIGVVPNPIFTALTAGDINSTGITTSILNADFIFSGGFELSTIFGGNQSLESVTSIGNIAERNIVLYGNGSGFNLVRKVIFRETNPLISGRTDASIGLDYPANGPNAGLSLWSPNSMFFRTDINYFSVFDLEAFTNYHYGFYGLSGATVPPIKMGFASASTIPEYYNFIGLSSIKDSSFDHGTVFITATGITSNSYPSYFINLPAKSGTFALLDDVVAGSITRVQPGTNISTGGTASVPIINVIDDPVFSSVNANQIFSGGMELSQVFSSFTNPTLEIVTNNGNIADTDIILQGNNDFNLVRTVRFRDTGIYSGSTDGYIGYDYNIAGGPSLLVDSPFSIFNISRYPVQNSDIADIDIAGSSYHHKFYNTNAINFVELGFLSATTENEYLSYASIDSRDLTGNIGKRVFLIASGASSLGVSENFFVNFQSKDGVVALLSDLTGSTTGGTQTLDQVLEQGNTGFGKNLLLSGTSSSGGSIFAGIDHYFDETNAASITGATILGGRQNVLSGNTSNSTIIGGYKSRIMDSTDSIIMNSYNSGFFSVDSNSIHNSSLSSLISSRDSKISNTYYGGILFSQGDCLIDNGSDSALMIGTFASTATSYGFNALIVGGSSNLVQFEDAGGYASMFAARQTTINGINNNLALGGLGNQFNYTNESFLLSSRYSSFNQGQYGGIINSEYATLTGGITTVIINSSQSYGGQIFGSSLFNSYSSSILSANSVSIFNSVSSRIFGTATYASGMTGSTIIGGQFNILSGFTQGSTILGGFGGVMRHTGSTILGGHDLISDDHDTVFMMNAKASGNIFASTIFSGGVDVSLLFLSTASTFVQSLSAGANISLGGTAANPSINVIGSPVLTGLTSGTISGTSISAETLTATTVRANSIILEAYSATTSATSITSGLKIYDRKKAGRNQLETFDPIGQTTTFQSHFGTTNVRYIKAVGNGGTTLATLGLVPAIGGTSQPKSYSTASLLGSLQRVGMRTTATQQTTASLITNNGGAVPFWLGNAANLGGFHMICRFGIAQSQTNMRWFVGLYSAVTAISNVEPSSLGSIIGFGIDSGQTTIRFINNDNAGTATMTDLGSNFPATTANAVYEVQLYTPPCGTTIYYSIERLDASSPTILEGEVNTNIPSNTTFLGGHLYINNSTTAADAIMDFIQLHIETKY